MRPQSRLVATFLVVSLLLPSFPAVSSTGATDSTGAEVENLGIVVASHSATLGNGIASDGATLFNGDRLVTGPNGGLSLRSGAAMLYMSGSTQVTLHRTPSRNPVITKALIRADVTSGSISFSLAPDQYFLASAHGALIGPAAPMSTLGEISILGHKAFEIRARRGPLKIVYRDDSEIIPEGKSYRVELDDGPDTNSTTNPPSMKTARTRPAGRRRFILVFLIGVAAVAAAGTAVGYTQSVESPDCPQPNQCSRPN